MLYTVVHVWYTYSEHISLNQVTKQELRKSYSKTSLSDPRLFLFIRLGWGKVHPSACSAQKYVQMKWIVTFFCKAGVKNGIFAMSC